jgi:hypothetical protein
MQAKGGNLTSHQQIGQATGQGGHVLGLGKQALESNGRFSGNTRTRDSEPEGGHCKASIMSTGSRGGILCSRLVAFSNPYRPGHVAIALAPRHVFRLECRYRVTRPWIITSPVCFADQTNSLVQFRPVDMRHAATCPLPIPIPWEAATTLPVAWPLTLAASHSQAG